MGWVESVSCRHGRPLTNGLSAIFATNGTGMCGAFILLPCFTSPSTHALSHLNHKEPVIAVSSYLSVPALRVKLGLISTFCLCGLTQYRLGPVIQGLICVDSSSLGMKTSSYSAMPSYVVLPGLTFSTLRRTGSSDRRRLRFFPCYLARHRCLHWNVSIMSRIVDRHDALCLL